MSHTICKHQVNKKKCNNLRLGSPYSIQIYKTRNTLVKVLITNAENRKRISVAGETNANKITYLPNSLTPFIFIVYCFTLNNNKKKNYDAGLIILGSIDIIETKTNYIFLFTKHNSHIPKTT